MTKRAIEMTLAPQTEDEKKQIEFLEAQRLRIDRLEVVLDDHRAHLKKFFRWS